LFLTTPVTGSLRKNVGYFVTSFFGKHKKIGSQYYHKNVATFCGYFVTKFCGKPKNKYQHFA
jgi:hypothetical protein